MLTTFTAVLTASLLGSLHCAGMCGPFCAVATTPTPSSGVRAARLTINGGAIGAVGVRGVGGVLAAVSSPFLRPLGALHLHVAMPLAYNLGRLATYLALGVAAGMLGGAVDLGGSSVGVQRLAAGLAGMMMIAFGAVGVARLAGVHVRAARCPDRLHRLLATAHTWAGRWGAVSRSAIIGMLTTLLPCGWLYAFVVSAGGTANPWSGAGVMLAFWLGTLPVMAAVSLGLHYSLEPVRRSIPLLTALALIAIGVLTLMGRIGQMPGMFASTQGVFAPVCH